MKIEYEWKFIKDDSKNLYFFVFNETGHAIYCYNDFKKSVFGDDYEIAKILFFIVALNSSNCTLDKLDPALEWRVPKNPRIVNVINKRFNQPHGIINDPQKFYDNLMQKSNNEILADTKAGIIFDLDNI